MNNCKASIAILVVVVTLMACQKQQPVPPPNVRTNPNAVQRFEIIATFEDGPSLSRFSGTVQYGIENYTKCLPPDHTVALGGVTPNPKKEKIIHFNRTESGAYTAEFFNDAFLDEDYYGLGVCNWNVSAVSAKLDMPSSMFSRLGVSGVELIERLSIVQRSCLKKEYIQTGIEAICRALPGGRPGEGLLDKYFTVTMKARRK